jgi:hypothetical protein
MMATANDRCPDVQEDALDSFADRGQPNQLRHASVSPCGCRTRGLKLDDPRTLAVLAAPLCFASVVGRGRSRTSELHATAVQALGKTTEIYSLGQPRYNPAMLRANGVVERMARTQTCRMPSRGCRIEVPYWKLSHRTYAPLLVVIAAPDTWDERLPPERPASLEELYVAVSRALKHVLGSVNLRTGMRQNHKKRLIKEGKDVHRIRASAPLTPELRQIHAVPLNLRKE